MQIHLPPKPVPDRDTQPFWDAVARRRLVVQQCAVCARWIWQPKPVCPWCNAIEPVWTEVAGDARVASWTVVHAPVLPVWEFKIPFTIVLAELTEAPGVRMVGQLLDDRGELVLGTPVIDFADRLSLRWRVDEAKQELPGWTRVPS